MARASTLITRLRVALIPVILLSSPALGQPKRSGCEVVVYWDGGFGGEAWRTTDDQPSAGAHWAKQITSIIVLSGIWDFYLEDRYRGEVITFPPGAYSYVGDKWNDKINSFRCVRPTQ